MKKNFYLIIFFAMVSLSTNGESPCRVALELNGVVQNYMTTNFNVAINQGDTLICSAWTGSVCGTCTIDLSATFWVFNGDTMNVVTIAATDTGVYTLYAKSDGGSSCAWTDNIFFLTINYSTTSVTEMTTNNGIEFIPTLTDGIFKIKGNDKNLVQLFVSNCMGRIVFITKTNFSEINLTRFSPGIYFYAITDEKNKVWRGRLVKE